MNFENASNTIFIIITVRSDWCTSDFQTWFPFTIQIYLNGKEYLKKQLAKANIPFTSYKNSITSVSDISRAQQLADQLIQKKWTKVFDHFARQVNGFLPRIEEIFNQHGYYWYIEQCEYATVF